MEARAKHLLIRCSGGLVLHTHMQMTGSWHVYPTGERWRKPARQARIVLESGSRLAVCFNAPVIELLSERDLRSHPVLRRLGPDVLIPESLEPSVVGSRARQRASQSPTIGELLLDQQVVSGIGNIYRCESLFLCRLDPTTLVDALGELQLMKVVTTASRLMQSNAFEGSAFNRSFEGATQQPWVYGRAGHPCRRCRTPIRRMVLGRQARTVYWCPGCQPPP